ncbi:probable methyltransferase TARBP1 [Bolinopsis microptera]|uniref:probable methyltransferase TARBP1 n=1 Tax=Bolinopsis microptera TaxID=2820187 RepID=UPI003079C714
MSEELLSNFLTSTENLGTNISELGKLLLDEHGAKATSLCINALICAKLPDTIYYNRIEQFLELTRALQHGISTTEIIDQWNILTVMICDKFAECEYQTCLLVSKVLSVIVETHNHRLLFPVGEFRLQLKRIYSAVTTEEMDHSAVSALTGIFEIPLTFSFDIKNDFISDLIEHLPSKALLITLSDITSSLSFDSNLVSSILHRPTLWDKLIECFNDKDCCIRKRSLFLVNFLMTTPNISYPADRKEIMEDLLVVLETLEETQGHIIRPVLAKIPKLYDYATEEKLDIRWVATIFNRLMFQESKMISRWGFQLLLDLPPKAFLTKEGITVLETLLFSHIHNTYMFYRPNFIAKGEGPPIFHQLKNYFTTILCEADSSISKSFLKNLLVFLSKTKSSSTPLTMLTHLLSNIKLPYKVGEGCVHQLAQLCRTVLSTQPHKVKGAVQGFMLRFISNNVAVNGKDVLCSIQTLLNLVYIEHTLDSNHSLWKELSLLVKDYDAETAGRAFEDFVMQELAIQKESFAKTQGFALLLAMGDDQGLLHDKIITSVFQPLLNCGMNLYVSKNSVIISVISVNIVLHFFKGRSKNSDILKFCQDNSSSIFENCSLFFIRHSEDIHQSKSISTESKQGLKHLACFLANFSAQFMLQQGMVPSFIIDLLSSIKNKESESLVMVQSSVVIQAIYRIKDSYELSLPESPGSLEWLLPYLSSESLVNLESSWTCFAFLYPYTTEFDNKDICNVFNLGIESIQKMKDPYVIQMIFNFIKHITPKIINEDAEMFYESLPYTVGVLQDFSNSGTYWDLLDSFCSTMFNPTVLDHPECAKAVIKTVFDFKELTHSKEMVMGLVVEHLSLYTTCEMKNAACYLDLLTDLSLFGVTQSREKQNQDDLMAYIEHLGEEIPVNTLYQRLKKGVPFVRVQVLNMLFVIIERFPALSTTVVDFYLTSFRNLDKSALQNSLPNRTKIRIAQALLCLIPAVVKKMNNEGINSLLKDVMMCLTLESQPSVRCFIECGACYILSKHPDTVSSVFGMMETSRKVTNSNALLSALFSILYHHLMYLNEKKLLEKSLLDEALQRISVWTCANNHNVRSFACCCLVLLSPVYDKHNWDLPHYYKIQVDFITESTEYSKLLSKHIEKKVFFSKFNIINDLCLFNIFLSLPQQHSVLENECVMKREIEGFDFQMDYPVISGNFMELPKPESREQLDYIIRFKDLTEFSSLQKKITPWQIMATNLGIDFDRGSTEKGDLVVFASLISKGNNLGGLSRTGEIFGVKTMVVNNLEVLNNKDFKSLSMTSEKWIEFEEVSYDTTPTVEYFKKMKRLGYTIVGVEQASDSVNLDRFQFPRKSVLVLGRERDGIPVELLSHLDVCVEIPQLGLIRSLNVHVSASIMIWEYSKQHLFADSNLIKTEGC